MDTIEALLTRRSIRKFTNKPVTDDQLQTILKAAMYAPSAGNQQPWEFLVITDRAMLNRIPDAHPYAKMALTAQIAILVCANASRFSKEPMWSQDCSAATQNILLAAHAQGLGAVWCGVYPRAERMVGLSDLLKLPDNIIPFSLVPIGWPAEEKGDPNRFDKCRIHIDKW